MTWGMVAMATATVISANSASKSASAQSQAAGQAADTQAGAAQAGIDEQRRQFDLTQNLLQPYTQAGAPALRRPDPLCLHDMPVPFPS